MALFDSADLAAFLQATVSDGPAARAISQAETYLRAHLAIELTQDEWTVTERVLRTATTVQLRGPIVDVASVTVDGAPLSSADWERTRRGVVCPAGFGQGLDSDGAWCDVTIVYTGGFETPPTDLVDWGLWLAAAAYTRAPGGAVQQQAVGGVSATYGSASMVEALRLPADILRGLQHTYGRPTSVPSLRSVDIR